MDGPAPADPRRSGGASACGRSICADWIELGPDADAAIAAKPRLMAQYPDTVFAVLDAEVERESHEVADALVDHLRRRWPDRYGDVTLDPQLHPLDAAARLVPEDLVLLVERDGQLVFGGGSVCFPNRWDLRSKLGLTMAGVHAPVARLNDQLEDADRRVLRPAHAPTQLLAPRLGRSSTHADWYTPVDGTAAPRPAAVRRPRTLFCASNVRRCGGSRRPSCVLFTIRTYVTPIPLAASSSGVADRLAASLDSLPDDVRGYKDLVATTHRAERIRAVRCG